MKGDVTIVSCRRPQEEGKPFEIVFGNGEVLSFTEEEVLEYGLYREGESCGNYENLCTEILAKRMMASAASYVLFSKKTEAQVRKRIAEKFAGAEAVAGWEKFAGAALDETIRRLKELGYLDDAAYCRKYIASSLRTKPVSRAALLNDLVYRKGIAKETAEAAAAAVYAEHDCLTDEENAYRLLYKKTGGRIPQEEKELAKLFRFLAGKGFSYRCAESAMRRIKEEGETNA